MDGCLGCFHLLAVVNNTAMNTGVQIAFQGPFSIILGIYPEVGFLDQVVILFTIF